MSDFKTLPVNLEIIDILLDIEDFDIIDGGEEDDWLKPDNDSFLELLPSSKIIELKDKLAGFETLDILKVVAFYYYGRAFVDGSINSFDSYTNFLDKYKELSRERAISELSGKAYSFVKTCFKTAKEQYVFHETNVELERKKYQKVLERYTKKEGSFLNRRGNGDISKSSSETFESVANSHYLQETDDIDIATKILSEVIDKTDGLVIVDFLGLEYFDHLDYVENNDGMLNIYKDYSRGINENPRPPHNIRIDLKFEKLEFIKHRCGLAIGLKGFYVDEKALKIHLNQKEKVRKSKIIENQHSQFYYELEFDKKQRGALENFQVTLLPWRFFNVIILPKNPIVNQQYTTEVLINKNLKDIKKRLLDTKNEFNKARCISEDCLKMFGNRYRSIVESLLKFICLASGIMFKECYSKDMLGQLLKQIKIHKENANSFYTNSSKLGEFLDIVESGLQDKLNATSHDNVSKKIENSDIEEISQNVHMLLAKSYECFNLRSKL